MLRSRIGEFIKAKGTTYLQILSATGLSSKTVRTAIVRIEKLNMGTLARFADYFGVSVKDLFYDTCWEREKGKREKEKMPEK